MFLPFLLSAVRLMVFVFAKRQEVSISDRQGPNCQMGTQQGWGPPEMEMHTEPRCICSLKT